MKKKLLLVMGLVLIGSLLSAPLGLAKEEVEINQAIGLGGSPLIGPGISYKYFFTPKQGIQVTGSLVGSSEATISYKLGTMYQKVMAETDLTRLFFAPGIGWQQTIDANEEDDITKIDSKDEEVVYYTNQADKKRLTMGINWGAEFKIDRVGLSLYSGLQGSANWYYPSNEYDSREKARQVEWERGYDYGLTGGIFVTYYY